MDVRQIRGFEMTAFRRLLRVSWTTHRTNTSVLQEKQPQERLLATVRRCKLQYFGHVVRARNLCTEILEGRIDRKKRRGRPMRRWTDDVKDWSNRSVAERSRLARDRQQCRLLVHEMISDPQQLGRKQEEREDTLTLLVHEGQLTLLSKGGSRTTRGKNGEPANLSSSAKQLLKWR